MNVRQQVKRKLRRHWWGLSTAASIVALLLMIGWGVHDFLSPEPATVHLRAKLQEFGTIYWHPVDISDIIWGDSLSFQAQVEGKQLTFRAEYDGSLRVKISCLPPTLEKWDLYQDNDSARLLRGTQVVAPLLALQTEDPLKVRVDMTQFTVLGLVYHSDGTILEVRNITKQSSSAEVIGVSGQPFNMLFEKGYEGGKGPVAGPITFPDGKLTTPFLWFAEGQEELTVLVTSEARGYDISFFYLLEPKPRVQIQAGEQGVVKIHTKVRSVALGGNPSELEIEERGLNVISREEVLKIGLIGKYGGEMYLSTDEGVLDVTGTAGRVNINGREQLANKLDGWRWYEQYLFVGLVLSSLLGLLGVRYRQWRGSLK